ncbi:MAG: hypothetical protein WBL67_06765 [Nitrososphaeraceae archaeon]
MKKGIAGSNEIVVGLTNESYGPHPFTTSKCDMLNLVSLVILVRKSYLRRIITMAQGRFERL